MYNNTNSSYAPVQQAQQQQQPIYTSYMMNRPIYQSQQQYIGIKGRPVASIEEARASIIDFDGSIFYFPDLANKRIYTKQINIDGTAILNMYELKEIPVEQEITPNQYITREEFESVISSLRAAVQPVAAPNKPVQVEQPAAKPLLNF